MVVLEPDTKCPLGPMPVTTDAEDLVQDTMLRAHAASRTCHQGTNLKRCARRPLYAMGVGATIAALFISATPAQAHGEPPSSSVDGCADVEVVFARGTFESPGVGKVGEPFIAALRQRLPGRTVDDYAVNYPASLQFDRAVEGIADAGDHLRNLKTTCPSTKTVLGGYSQGAAVSGYLTSPIAPAGYDLTTLPSDVAKNITAVVLFGKPSPEMLGLLAHDAPPVDVGPAFADRTIDLCAPRDPVCEPGGLDREAHSAYAANGMVEQAADFVVDQLRTRHDDAHSSPTPRVTPSTN